MALLVAALLLVALTGGKAPAASAPSPHTGQRATCAMQSGASFPGAFTRRDNLVLGPLSMIGAGTPTPAATVDEFGGNKFPVLVRAGHVVTVEVARRANRAASLYYGRGGGVLTETRVRDGRRSITFRSCPARRAQSDADGEPVTFWSGFVVVDRPMCVPLKVWIDSRATGRRASIPLGRACKAAGHGARRTGT